MKTTAAIKKNCKRMRQRISMGRIAGRQAGIKRMREEQHLRVACAVRFDLPSRIERETGTSTTQSERANATNDSQKANRLQNILHDHFWFDLCAAERKEKKWCDAVWPWSWRYAHRFVSSVVCFLRRRFIRSSEILVQKMSHYIPFSVVSAVVVVVDIVYISTEINASDNT